MLYADLSEVKERLNRTLSEKEESVCTALLDDASVIIDTFNEYAPLEAKRIVACNMVIRAIGSGGDMNVPMGATQGTISAGGYSQTWTMSNGTGELYLTRIDKKLLGTAGRIGSSNPFAESVDECEE